jgi:hypothetical protein
MFKAQKQTNEKCYTGMNKYRAGRWPERLHFLRWRLIYFGSSIWNLPRSFLPVVFFLEDVSTSPVIYKQYSLQNSNAVLYEIPVSRGMFQQTIAQRKLNSSCQHGSEKNKCNRRMLLLRTGRSKWRSLGLRPNVRWTVRLRMCQAAEKIRFKVKETFVGDRRKNQTLLFSLMILSVEYSPCSP